jgi:hypothetical protein
MDSSAGNRMVDGGTLTHGGVILGKVVGYLACISRTVSFAEGAECLGLNMKNLFRMFRRPLTAVVDKQAAIIVGNLPFPGDVALETVNTCNARCPFCPLFQGAAPMDRKLRPAKLVDQSLFWLRGV